MIALRPMLALALLSGPSCTRGAGDPPAAAEVAPVVAPAFDRGALALAIASAQNRRAVDGTGRPAVIGGSDSGAERLDAEFVRGHVADEIVGAASRCYDQVRATEPGLVLRVDVELELVGEPELGAIVDGFTVLGASDERTPLFDCMTEAVRAVVLPPPPGPGRASVRQSWLFEPA